MSLFILLKEMTTNLQQAVDSHTFSIHLTEWTCDLKRRLIDLLGVITNLVVSSSPTLVRNFVNLTRYIVFPTNEIRIRESTHESWYLFYCFIFNDNVRAYIAFVFESHQFRFNVVLLFTYIMKIEDDILKLSLLC